MIRFFKRKSELESLQIKYQKLIRESMELGRTNRSKSDLKLAEANSLLQRIIFLEDEETSTEEGINDFQ